ncbi:MAG: RNA-guided endonuclease IscB [Ktedonobacteraceae bacterium]
MTQVIPDLIYVHSREGQPLMPTRRHHKVWYWLRKGLAHVVRREPLTVQLHFATALYTQPATVGVDTGSKTVGIAATTNGEVVYQAEVHLRTDITEKMTHRRQFRRTRRARKTRYRASRFANRRRKAGWLPPSLCSKAEATVKAVRYVSTLLPVSQVNVEIGSFDTQKVQNPEATGVIYQQGELYGYLVREYMLAKWKRRCAYCGATGVPLQLEHILPKARGGSDRVSNLTLACKPCNVRKGTQTAEEFGHPQIQAQAKVPLKDAAHVSSMKTAVVAHLREQFGSDQVSITFGYETKYKRIQVLNLPKSHHHDAVAIACSIGEAVRPLEIVYQIHCIPRGQYQRFNGPRSEHKCWSPRKVRGFKLYERVKVKGDVGYIAGRREKGSFVIKDVTSGKKLAEVTPRKLQHVARPTQGWMMTRQSFPENNRKEGGTSYPR